MHVDKGESVSEEFEYVFYAAERVTCTHEEKGYGLGEDTEQDKDRTQIARLP